MSDEKVRAFIAIAPDAALRQACADVAAAARGSCGWVLTTRGANWYNSNATSNRRWRGWECRRIGDYFDRI